jgi:ribosomal protein L11 methyltransferase
VPARFATFEVLAPSAYEDEATCALWECGTVGVHVESRPDARVALTASFADDPSIERRVREALSSIPGASLRPLDLPEVDWVARFRAEFRAFEAAGFQFVPAWEPGAIPSSRVLIVDPGRAFGTGTHQTTRLCLELLAEESARRPLGRVLDVGAGTGLLAVAALRLGAPLAVAVDLDPEATASSALHARLNDVPLAVLQGDGGRAIRPHAVDLVLANLMAPLLIERAGELRSLCAKGATLILSGLLAEDVEAVSAAYAFGAIEHRLDREWAALRVRLPEGGD